MYLANENRYDKMKYVRCGKSGIDLPAVSLGLWQNFGSLASYENSKEMALGAFDLGITHFDLANNYGPVYGSAEETFGKILKDDLGVYRDELIISSKAGFDMWKGPYGNFGSKKYLVASLDQSLKRMGLDYVDIFYHHRPDTTGTPLYETMDALAGIVKSGKALYAGISNYPAELAKEAIEMLDSMGVKMLIHQPSYSMLNRWVEDGLLDILEEKSIGSIAFSPLAQGMLSDKYLNGIPNGSRASVGRFLSEKNITEDVLKKVSALNSVAAKRGQTLAQMALSWVLRGGRITSVLVGASSLSQIEENVKALDNLEFDAVELEEIERILR